VFGVDMVAHQLGIVVCTLAARRNRWRAARCWQSGWLRLALVAHFLLPSRRCALRLLLNTTACCCSGSVSIASISKRRMRRQNAAAHQHAAASAASGDIDAHPAARAQHRAVLEEMS
jgi:hypothetical protein